MAKYAKRTDVPVIKSKQQIEKVLMDWGIKEYFWGVSPRGDGIAFKCKERLYKFNVPTPNSNHFSSQADYDRALRQRWRIMYMSLKMKLEEIDEGIVSFEDQFLAMMALPDGSTVADFMRLPENLQLLQKAEMPKMLTG